MLHVVVGVDRLLGAHLAAEHLDGAVGDHLVGVHVGLGAGAGLPDDEREVIVELAVDDFLRGGDDGLAKFGVHLAQSMLVSAAARLTMPSARTMGCGCFSQPILKLPSERCACAPQYFEASTSMGPKVSVSVRVFAIGCQAPSVSIKSDDARHSMGCAPVPVRQMDKSDVEIRVLLPAQAH
jgi:hypothetical protein